MRPGQPRQQNSETFHGRRRGDRLKRVWLWWSTGKDSAWALHKLGSDPGVRVERLVTTVTPKFDRVAIHGTRLEVLRAQADSVGLPLELVELPFPCSNDEYIRAVAPILRMAESESIDHMAFGDLLLEDVRAYRETLFVESSIEPVFPIWGEDTEALAAEMLASGVEAYITSLDPARLAAELVGARYDADFLSQLPPGVDPCGENGEFHTCVTSGPMFRNAIRLDPGEIVERSGFLYADFQVSGVTLRPSRSY